MPLPIPNNSKRAFFKELSPPQVMPKLHSDSIFHFKQNMMQSMRSSYRFSKTHTIRTLHLLGTPPSQSLPYFTSVTLLQSNSVSVSNLQNHFPKRAWLNCFRYLEANPPFQRGEQILVQFTEWNLDSLPKPLHKNCVTFNTISNVSWNRKNRKKIS